MSRPTNGDSLGAKVLLALATVLLMLGGAEIGLSWLHPTEYLRVPEKTPGDPFYGLLHRPSDYPDLLYELAPNQQKKFERIMEISRRAAACFPKEGVDIDEMLYDERGLPKS